MQSEAEEKALNVNQGSSNILQEMLKGNSLNPQILQYLESLNRLAAGREKILEMQNKLMETN
jgi:hypothetical protein